MADRWKQHERMVAKWLGGHRVISKGTRSEDVEHPLFSVEVKSRASLPRWLLEAMNQAITNCAKDKAPLLVIHHVGAYHENDMVVLRMGDFVDLLRKVRNDKR